MGITFHRVTVAEIVIATATRRREPFFPPGCNSRQVDIVRTTFGREGQNQVCEALLVG
jgi:hypothetical protein